ncbi:IclR family transcriptional regulator, partial [Burkholderia multivorans]
MRDTTPAPPDAAPDDARVLRALAVLEALASGGQPYTLSQLAARLHIPKATLLRLIE